MNRQTLLTTSVLFVLAISFTLFAIQSGDVFMYLALARDFILQGDFAPKDPYLYSLPLADLHVAHEYLSYLIFYAAYLCLGTTGLILLKVLLLSIMFSVALRASPKANNAAPFWMLLWGLAVVAGSFRFIERSSLFSDLFCVVLVYWLLEEKKITRSLITRLTLLFFLWVQLHPGFPLGLGLLLIWTAWHCFWTREISGRQIAWLGLPVAALAINPLGLDGALYPFRFALREAAVLKRHNFEWFPSYHPAFRFTPEVSAFWILVAFTLFLLWRQRAWRTVRGPLVVFAILNAIQAVRFVPWASFALIILIKPWAALQMDLKLNRRIGLGLSGLFAILSIANFAKGYASSSGPRLPGFKLDTAFFPVKTLEFLRAHPIAGRLYNSHDFGSYLIWQGYTPIFHHGFVTEMNFYENEVVGVFASQARFLELATKYKWTMLLVDKHGSYAYFYKILGPLTDWKIVAEDDASYLIYYLPDEKKL